jgi:aminoglycoside phosphotransferase (APT) family kinase protein
MPLNPDTLSATLEQALGWKAITLTRMTGATSAALFEARSGRNTCVVKVFDAQRWPSPVADVSRHEAGILTALADQPVPTPQMLALLPDNGVAMSRMPGQVQLPAVPGGKWLRAQAALLTDIHRLPVTVPWHYESWNQVRATPAPDWWPDGGLWVAARQATASTPAAPDVFIHRDFHPVNLLWSDDEIVAVVDWTNGCMGPAAVDVAHCRLNLAMMYGVEAADAFRRSYQQLNPHWRYAAYWDIDGAFSTLPQPKPYPPWSDFGLSGLTVDIIRNRLVAFVRAALDRGDP